MQFFIREKRGGGGERTKPPLVSLHPSVRGVLLSLLERGLFDNLSVPVSDRFSTRQELLLSSGVGVHVEILSC